MVLGAMAPFFALRGNLVASAHFATGSLFAVIVSTSYATGGIAQAGYAWVYVVPLVAGLLGGVRCLAIWGPLALAATLTMCLRRHRPGAASRWPFPRPSRETQGIFDIVLIFVTVLLIIGTFLRTRTLAERETQSHGRGARAGRGRRRARPTRRRAPSWRR